MCVLSPRYRLAIRAGRPKRPRRKVSAHRQRVAFEQTANTTPVQSMANLPSPETARLSLRSATGERFVGFHRRTLLGGENLPLHNLAELAVRHGQFTSPLDRVHRWFGRTLSTQFRSRL